MNGVWVFFLTLVPFATGWVGEFPFSPLPECSYAVVMLIWTFSLEMMDRQIIKENPNEELEFYHERKIQIFEYLGFIIAMVAAYFEPISCLTIIHHICGQRVFPKQKK